MSELIDRQALIFEIAKLEKIVPCYFHGEMPSEAHFNAGLHAAMGIIQSQPPASPWHRVKENPKTEGRYLTCDKIGLIHLNWWGPKYGWAYDPKLFRYWMSLPEPPKEDADGDQ